VFEPVREPSYPQLWLKLKPPLPSTFFLLSTLTYPGVCVSELVTRLRNLKPPQERATGTLVGTYAPLELIAPPPSAGGVAVDPETVRVLAEVVHRVAGRDYVDYVQAVCSSTPASVGVCRELAEVVRRCDPRRIPRATPAHLDSLAGYVREYVERFCG
jgi:hypothetical protein